MKRTTLNSWRIILTALFLILSVVICSGVYAAPNISDINDSIDVSGNRVSLTLDYWEGRSGEISFIACAVDKSTGEIKGMEIDTKNGSSHGDLTFNLNIENLRSFSNTAIEYYLWGAANQSLVNCSPNGVETAHIEPKVIENKLSWDAPPDDYDEIAYYEVHDIDAAPTLIAETKNTFYIDGRSRILKPNKLYRYKVIPVDGLGNRGSSIESIPGEDSSIAVTTTKKPFSWKQNVADGVTFAAFAKSTKDNPASNNKQYNVVKTKAGKTVRCIDYSDVYDADNNSEGFQPEIKYAIYFSGFDGNGEMTLYDRLAVNVTYYDIYDDDVVLELAYNGFNENADGTLTREMRYARVAETDGVGTWKTVSYELEKFTTDGKEFKFLLDGTYNWIGNAGFFRGAQFRFCAKKAGAPASDPDGVPFYSAFVSEVEVAKDDYNMPKSSLGAVEYLNASADFDSITLNWGEPSGAVVGYNIYDDATGLLIAETDELEYTVSYLRSGTNYSYTVVPFDANGCEGVSATATCTTDEYRVNNLQAENIGDCRVKLSWEEPTYGEFSRYAVYDMTDTPTRIATTAELEYEITDVLDEGEEYVYAVTPVYDNGTEVHISKAIPVAVTVSRYVTESDFILSGVEKVNGVKLSWPVGEETDTYEIYRLPAKDEYGDEINYHQPPDDAVAILTIDSDNAYEYIVDDAFLFADKYFSTLENYFGETTNGIGIGFTGGDTGDVRDDYTYFVVKNEGTLSTKVTAGANFNLMMAYFTMKDIPQDPLPGKTSMTNLRYDSETGILLNKNIRPTTANDPWPYFEKLESPVALENPDIEGNTLYQFTGTTSMSTGAYLGDWRGKFAYGLVYGNLINGDVRKSVTNETFKFGTTSSSGLTFSGDSDYIFLLNASLDEGLQYTNLINSGYTSVFGKVIALNELDVVADSEETQITYTISDSNVLTVDGLRTDDNEFVDNTWATYIADITSDSTNSTIELRYTAVNADNFNVKYNENGERAGIYSIAVVNKEDYIK